jgi:hypothetical protein
MSFITLRRIFSRYGLGKDITNYIAKFLTRGDICVVSIAFIPKITLTDFQIEKMQDRAAELGSFNLLRWLYKNYIPLSAQALASAIGSRRSQAILDYIESQEFPEDFYQYRSRYKSPMFNRSDEEEYYGRLYHRAACAAAEVDRVDLMSRYINKQKPEYLSVKHILSAAIAHASSECFGYLTTTYGGIRDINIDDIGCAFKTGNLEFCKTLLARCANFTIQQKGAAYAASSGHIHIIKWLHTEYKISLDNNIFTAAEVHGHSNLVQWLLDNNCEFDKKDRDIRLKHLSSLQHEIKCERCFHEHHIIRKMADKSWKGDRDIIEVTKIAKKSRACDAEETMKAADAVRFGAKPKNSKFTIKISSYYWWSDL